VGTHLMYPCKSIGSVKYRLACSLETSCISAIAVRKSFPQTQQRKDSMSTFVVSAGPGGNLN
jgi:hypothetical protein